MSEELWYVKLANGDVHRVTLDQLDGAFQAGHIDESTMVLGADATEWMSLGALLGDDGESDAQAAHAAPQAAHVKVTQPAATRASAYAQPGGYGYTPPAATPSYAPPAKTYGYAQPQTAGTSLRPMSLDLGDASDYDLEYPKRSKKPLVATIFAFAAIAAGVGFVTQQRAHHSGGDDLATVAAAAAMVAPHDTTPAAPPPVAAPMPSPAVAAPAVVPASVTQPAPGGGSPLNPQFTTRFNEEQKTKLLAADKTHETKAKAKHAGGGASHAASKSTGKSTTFTTGGNKFDPLNSSI